MKLDPEDFITKHLGNIFDRIITQRPMDKVTNCILWKRFSGISLDVVCVWVWVGWEDMKLLQDKGDRCSF